MIGVRMTQTRQLAVFSVVASMSVLVGLCLYASLQGPRLTKNLRRQWSPGYSHYISQQDGSGKNSTAAAEKLAPRFPRALIIGFTKCGTAALKSFLELHPNIVSPKRALRFFNDNYDKGLQWYRDQMPESKVSQITVERSAGYVNSEVAMQRIREYNPNVLLIALVRDPIVRLQSEFARVRSKVAKESSREMSFNSWLGRNWQSSENFLRLVDYASILSHVFKLFPKDQVLVLNGDDFETKPIAVLEETRKFLGLTQPFSESQLAYNKAKGFYCFNTTDPSYPSVLDKGNVVLNVETGCLGNRKGRDHPNIDKNILREMIKVIRPMNDRLFQLIGKKFKWEHFEES